MCWVIGQSIKQTKYWDKDKKNDLKKNQSLKVTMHHSDRNDLVVFERFVSQKVF